MRTRGVLLGVVALMVVAGCGSESEPQAAGGSTTTDTTSASPTEAAPSETGTPSATPTKKPSPSLSAAGLPVCAQVWQDGVAMPRKYDGCRVGKEAVAPEQRGCSFGKLLVTYDDHFYAVRGGTIHGTTTALAKDKGYRDALESCTA